MKVSELLSKARVVPGNAIKYRQGAGGMNPKAPLPVNMNNECDNSGYVAWCLGISRSTSHPLYLRFNNGWITPDSLVEDGKSPVGFFWSLETPAPGCLVVFPGKPPGTKGGHVAIVTSVRRDEVERIIHCSSANQRLTGDAVQETGPGVFYGRDVWYLWYAGLE